MTETHRQRVSSKPGLSFVALSMLVTWSASGQVAPPTTVDAGLAQEIQALRTEGVSEPAELKGLYWEPFRAETANPACSVQFLAGLRAVTAPCTAEGEKVGMAALRLMGAAFAPQHFPSPPGQSLQDVADVAGVEMSVLTCVMKGIARLRFGRGPIGDRAVRLIDGAAGAKQLVELLSALKTGIGKIGEGFWDEAKKVLDEVAEESARAPSGYGQLAPYLGAADTTLGPTQVGGWLDSIAGAANTIVPSAQAWLRGSEAAEAFEACEVDEALAFQESFEQAYIDFALDMRSLIEELEVNAYCHSKGISAASVYPDYRLGLAVLFKAYQVQLDGVSEYFKPAWAEQASVQAKRDEVTAAQAAFAHLPKMLAQAIQQCDASSHLRRLDGMRGGCFEALDKRPSGSVAGQSRRDVVRQDLARFQSAKETFAGRFGPAVVEARSLLSECRLADALTRVHNVSREWDKEPHYPHRPGLKSGALRGCVTPWPPDQIAEDVDAIRAQTQDRLEAAQISLRLAQSLVQEAIPAEGLCPLEKVPDLLAAALDNFHAAQCPRISVSKTKWLERYDAARGDLDARLGDLTHRGQELEQSRWELLSSMDEELAASKMNQNPGRCEAARNVIEMASLASGFPSSNACMSASTNAGFLESAARLAALAQSELQRGLETLQREIRFAGTAKERCDLDAFDTHSRQIESLPVVCDPASGANLARLRTERSELVVEVQHLRSLIAGLEADWASAEGECSWPAMASVANRIKIASNNSCRNSLEVAERSRLVRLRERSQVWAALRSEVLDARARLAAQLESARAYLRTRDAPREGLSNPTHHLQHAQRQLADARTVLASISGEIPDVCLEPELSELRELDAIVNSSQEETRSDRPGEDYDPFVDPDRDSDPSGGSSVDPGAADQEIGASQIVTEPAIEIGAFGAPRPLPPRDPRHTGFGSQNDRRGRGRHGRDAVDINDPSIVEGGLSAGDLIQEPAEDGGSGCCGDTNGGTSGGAGGDDGDAGANGGAHGEDSPRSCPDAVAALRTFSDQYHQRIQSLGELDGDDCRWLVDLQNDLIRGFEDVERACGRRAEGQDLLEQQLEQFQEICSAVSGGSGDDGSGLQPSALFGGGNPCSSCSEALFINCMGLYDDEPYCSKHAGNCPSCPSGADLSCSNVRASCIQNLMYMKSKNRPEWDLATLRQKAEPSCAKCE